MANIFFGISSESHIRNNIDKWVSIAGAPDIFSERDDHIEKYQMKLLGKYDLVSIDEALKRYPAADVWVTFPRVGNMPNMLAEKLPPKRIHFLEADLEYRKGCSYLGNYIIYGRKSFAPCSVAGRYPVMKTSGSIRERLAQWQGDTTRLIDDIRHERPNKCLDCHLINYGFWRTSVKLNTLSLAANNPGDICNFRCVYCYSRKDLKHLKNDRDGFSTYEILQQLSEMPELDTEIFTIRLSNGEFCANKYYKEMIDILLKTKWKIHLSSNCSIYREKLASLMQTGRIFELVTSIDAGTPETFKKIKQVNSFYKVIENLKKYPVDKTRFIMKYIFLEGINDNETDIDGFYEIVKELGGIAMLANDIRTNFAPYTDTMRTLTLRLVEKAKADGIHVVPNRSFLSPQDAKFINESYANAALA